MPSMMKAPHSKGANCPMCDGGACKMADGGSVHVGSSSKEKGVHRSPDWQPNKGKSYAGTMVRGGAGASDEHKQMQREEARDAHAEVRSEQKDMPGPTSGRSGFAEGGDVEDDGDEELSHGLGKELMGALEAKDHKKLMGALEACVLHCMSKGDSDV